MKKVCVDVSQSVYEGTGVARFTTDFVKHLLHSPKAQNFEIYLFFSSLNHKLPEKISAHASKFGNVQIVNWLVPPRALSYLWGGKKIRNLVPSPVKNCDVFISSDWTQPPPGVAKHKITIVHDLIFKKFPNTVDPVIQDAQKSRFEYITRECDLIVCDSESTANDLGTYYPNIKSRIIINYPGVEPVASDSEINWQFPFAPKKYFLSVGKLEPRKNIPLLISAYEDFIRHEGMGNFELVIVGPKGWDVSEQRLARSGVHFLGAITDPELGALYKNALAFVYPTIYEGFGIPPLEAMYAGCPVILSKTSSLVEIADNTSAIYIDPYDKYAIVDAMQSLIKSPNLAETLVTNGRKNVEKFSWSAYIDKMIDEIDKMQI